MKGYDTLSGSNLPIGGLAPTADIAMVTSRSFSFLRTHYNIKWPSNGAQAGSREVVPGQELVTALLKALAERVPVDASWYCEKYPDVEEGIRNGQFGCAKHHYVEFGYFEDRFPRQIEVDDGFYQQEYPDISEHLASGRLASSQEHFEFYGFKEGRLPKSNWRLVG